MENIQIQRVSTYDKEQIEAVREFLKTNQLEMELPLDALYAAYDKGQIVGCGAIRGKIIKMLAVDETMRGSNLIGQLVSQIMSYAFQMEQDHLFIFTKPGNEKSFTYLGFTIIAHTDHVALFENKKSGIKDYVDDIKRRLPRASSYGAVVMNCNPFTLGHQYLIEEAVKKVDHLLVFVLSEDLSTFPADVRLKLVQEGTSHLDGVTVISSGPYMVSSATFPSYFLEEGHDRVKVHTELDAEVFARRIAGPLNISVRFLGEEPLSPTTAVYNETLKKTLEASSIHVEILKRKELDLKVISASSVRKYLGQGEAELAYRLVPETTKAFLMSKDASEIIETLKRETHLAKRI